MQEENFELSEEEYNLIINRRKLSTIRLNATPASTPQSSGKTNTSNPTASQERPRDVILGANRPAGWDEHCDLEKVHKGRLTQDHPFFFFEDEIFKKISNSDHNEEHKKIRRILGMPKQSPTKDRVYHLLTHMDMLWYENRLPLCFKKRQEDLKKEFKIGKDNVPEGQKKEGVLYPTPKVELPEWDESLYNIQENEEFTGKTYDYTKFYKEAI